MSFILRGDYSLTITLAGAPTTPLEVAGAYADYQAQNPAGNTGLGPPLPILASLADDSAVTLAAPPPDVYTSRIVDHLAVNNLDGSDATFTLTLTDGSNAFSPAVITLAAGDIFVMTRDKWLVLDANGQTKQAGGGGGTPGGSDTHIQFNDGGAFGGEAGFSYDKASNQATAPGLTVTEDLLLTGVITPSQITGDQNDYAPTGHATAFVLRLSSDALRNLTGLAGGAAGRAVWLQNVGAQTVVLVHESGSSTAANRFSLGGSNVQVRAGNSMLLRYDGTLSRWVALYQRVNLSQSTDVVGTLPVGNGGTGLSALGSALQRLRVNAGGSALEYFTKHTVRAYHDANQSIANATVAALALNSERNDTDNMHYTSDAALTGTVAKAGTTALVGTSTQFTTELAVGQVISVPGGGGTELRVVTVITDDTNLTVAVAFANTASGQTASRVSGAVVIRTAGKYNFSAQVEFAYHATGQRLILVRRETDSVDIVRTSQNAVGGSIETRVNGAALNVDCAQWDWFRVHVFQNSGGALNVTAGGEYSPYLAAERVE